MTIFNTGYACAANAWTRSRLLLAKLARIQASRSYHPERHYMRGPGPRWHAKHGPLGDRLLD